MYKTLILIILSIVIFAWTSSSFAETPKNEVDVKNTIINLIKLDDTKERAYIGRKDNNMWLEYLLKGPVESDKDSKELFKKPEFFDTDGNKPNKSKYTSCD